jgi:hypothetical protein
MALIIGKANDLLYTYIELFRYTNFEFLQHPYYNILTLNYLSVAREMENCMFYWMSRLKVRVSLFFPSSCLAANVKLSYLSIQLKIKCRFLVLWAIGSACDLQVG